MKKKSLFLILSLLTLVMVGLTGCIKTYVISVSSQNLCFGLDAGTQTVDISANCKWTIIPNETVDWYTINTMSGKNDTRITITVKPLEDGDYRGASFVVNSPAGHVRRTIFVSQNKLDFDGIINKVFGVKCVEHWNTDYAGQIIEDSYEKWEYDPYDTTQGHLMYFFEGGQGMQRKRAKDRAIYFPFEYDYDRDNSILHIVFHLENDSLEPYNPEVLCASDSLYRIFHEWKKDNWERADMRKIGVITPGQKALFQQKLSKRKKDEPLFITE